MALHAAIPALEDSRLRFTLERVLQTFRRAVQLETAARLRSRGKQTECRLVIVTIPGSHTASSRARYLRRRRHQKCADTANS